MRLALQGSEVDGLLGPLDDVVELTRPGAGREILPSSVSGDRHDHALVDLLGALDAAGQGRAGRDPGEDAYLGQLPRPDYGITRADGLLPVEQLGTANVD